MSRRTSPARRQAGFTIIELMIATMVFSVILLGATTALFQLERMYYRGIITSQTQTSSRAIMADISQQLQLSQNKVQFAASTPSYGGTVPFQAFCIANTRYSYVINGQVEAGSGQFNSDAGNGSSNHIEHGLWRDTKGDNQACTPLNLGLVNPEATPPLNGTVLAGSSGSELLAQNMRLAALSLSPDCGSNRLCTIDVHIIYGDNDLLAPDANKPLGCKTVFGDQWCASSHLTTQVFKRLQ
ncbi:MAG: prepilin-type N-terminal cleavage/methylation domain-containing protein [Candidatus Saccharimonadales bacterium]